MSRGSIVRRVVAGIAAVAATACGVLVATTVPANATSIPGGTITRSEVIARAIFWYNQRGSMTYSESRSPSTFYPDPQGAMYAPDCSAYVSMAWHTGLGQPNEQVGGYVTSTLPSISTQISFTELKPGDLIDDPAHHAILFDAWESDHVHFSYYSFGSTPIKHVIHASQADSQWSSHPPSGYNYYRYNKIVDDTAAVTQIAFQANTGSLYTWNPSSGASDTSYGMLAGTSPAVTPYASGWEAAFQANTGELYAYNSATGAANTHLSMLTGTSPAIASNGSGWEIAFQANDGFLHTRDSGGTATQVPYGMKSGTSPAITALSNGTYEIAFQANTGELYAYNTATGAAGTSYGMLAGTSPAITSVGTGWEAAFQANTGELYAYNSATGAVDTHLGMLTGTSPSIGSTGTGWEIAFQTNDGFLRTRDSSGGSVQIPYGMQVGTSPGI